MAAADTPLPLRPTLWHRYRQNSLAVVGMVLLLLFGLVALVGYPLLPDASPQANRQLPQLAKLPPGTTVHLLAIPQPQVASTSWLTTWWQGATDAYSYIPLHRPDVRQVNGQLVVKLWGGRQAGYALAEVEGYGVVQHTYWLGTDAFGRDMLSRLLLGTRISLGIGLLAVLVSLVLGVTLGAAAGYAGGRTDAAIQGGMTIIWSLPSLLLAISLAYVLGKGMQQLVLAIALSTWVDLARVVRGQVMALKQLPYIQAARVLGYSHVRIVLQHLLPNMAGPIVILACSNFATAILLEAGLSFLGLGVAPPTPTWGGMIQEGYAYVLFDNGKWLALFPGLSIVLLILSLNLVAIGLRDSLDPRQA